MSVHIGKEIKKKVEERKMTVVGLSRELGCHRTNIYRIFDSPTVDSGVLSRLSLILDFDFFKLYSDDIADRIN
ncbi:MAG: helix-turn-helix domain-containing protein [Bacteroidales bacterium]|nr:helix-turn-helix domain-containing protein [Bacteroidales bacterium]